MGLAITLLGKPGLARGGLPVPSPKGRKAWALLSYLACADGNATRDQLAGLLFGAADDPSRALRWNLTEIRRCLQGAGTVDGDPLVLKLRPGSFVDVHVLKTGTWIEAIALPGLGRDLLEGADPSSSAAFEGWLLNERRHLKAASAAVLREAALAQLARGHVEAAIEHAAKLVAVEPLDEGYQALLIRAYAIAGDDAAATRQLAACVALFRHELGVEPGKAVTAAIRAPQVMPVASISGVAAASAQLEAGTAAMKAGALDAALDCFRRAAAEAHSSGDLDLKARTLFSMGSALVHCGRGRYEEGAAVLHQVIEVTERTGEAVLSAAAHRELAWVELLAARYSRVAVLLETATKLACEDKGEVARILFVSGMALTEMARYTESMARLHESLALAEQVRDSKQSALSLAMLGKAHLLRRDLGAARKFLETALDLIRTNGWTWLEPWPEAYLAELELVEGNVTRAEKIFEHSFAMALQIGDPCFQCKSEAGLGLVEAARGKTEASIDRLQSALMRLAATPDHTWTMAYALDALCDVAVRQSPGQAKRWINDLETLSARTGMREYLVRAHLHRHRLGDATALEIARLIAVDIDNPHLQEQLTAAYQVA